MGKNEITIKNLINCTSYAINVNSILIHKYKNKSHEGVLNNEGHIIYKKKIFKSLTTWAKFCREGKGINGWDAVWYKEKKMSKIREEYIKDKKCATKKEKISEKLKDQIADFLKNKNENEDAPIDNKIKNTGIGAINLYKGKHTKFEDEEDIIIFHKNIKTISTGINVSGRGGAEKQILPLLCDGTKRIDETLYDFTQPHGAKIECKKQKDCQWFDIGKFDDLSEENKNIIMLFILHNDGKINNKLYYITLGKFLDICCNDEVYKTYGWERDNIKDASIKKKKYPRMQYKVPLYIKQFVKKYETNLNIFKIN